MKMPKNGETIAITICDVEEWKEPGSVFKAVPVPPHGRLIDADAVTLKDGPYEYDEWCEWALRQYQAAPTIIPAEEGE